MWDVGTDVTHSMVCLPSSATTAEPREMLYGGTVELVWAQRTNGTYGRHIANTVEALRDCGKRLSSHKLNKKDAMDHKIRRKQIRDDG